MASKVNGYVYNKIYSDMGGVDFSGEPSQISPHSFAYLENMYRDYDARSGGGVETIPGFRKVCSHESPIHGMYPHPSDSDSFLIHAGAQLCALNTQDLESATALEPLSAPDSFRLAKRRSHAVITDGKLLLLDGQTFCVATGSSVAPVAEKPYVPTTYSDGLAYEQRNLLTPEAVEEYHLFDLSAYQYASPELVYSVKAGVCTVVGVKGAPTSIFIPSRVRINNVEYTVSGIAEDAFFGNTSIQHMVITKGVTLLGMRAFLGMKALESAVIPSTVVTIPSQCFDGCTALKTLYLSRGLEVVSDLAFGNAPLKNVYFEGTYEEFDKIQGNVNIIPLSNPNGISLHCQSLYDRAHLCFPIHETLEAVLSVTIGGVRVPEGESGSLFYRVIDGTHEQPSLKRIYLEYQFIDQFYGATLEISLRYLDIPPPGIMPGKAGPEGVGPAILNACRLIASYDGRIFLSGHPKNPGTVFYSQRQSDGEFDPTYFGFYNYFTDGDKKVQVRSLLATATYLLVLTEDPYAGASVFFHTGADTGDNLMPRVYPAVEGTGGVRALGEAAVFLDDTLFLSELGLEAIEKPTLSEERAIVHRSSAVDAKLCSERLSDAVCFRYSSYFGIAVDGHVYLADGRRRIKRDGHTEYEWYFLSDIGEYLGQHDRYHLCSQCPKELLEERVTVGTLSLPLQTSEEESYVKEGETVYSQRTASGTTYCYIVRDGRALLVDSTGEQTGGSFAPASAFFECNGRLFFGTQEGGVFVFNTDKRDADGIIPRRYYTFNGRAYLSGCATKSDHCDLPHLSKTTVRGSGAVKLKAMTGGKVEVRVRTDREGWSVCDVLHGGRLDYSETDFASAEFRAEPETVVRMRETKRRWAEKQLYFVSEEYQRPFGIVTIAYQYRVAGRIKG